MQIPTIQGVIRRRILLNYRVAPEVVKRVLPACFEPKLFKGYAIAGICLIRLEGMRPKGFPAFVGISSENSAHRIAVEWQDADGHSQEGVFIPRRDTSSLINSLAGGRIFPGVHQYSRFTIHDNDGRISLAVKVADHEAPLVEIEVEESADFPAPSVFESLEESSQFFEGGCIGYSSRPDSCILDGLSLEVPDWRVTSLAVKLVRSTFFDDREMFPDGQIEFDHALLMRDIPHEWHPRPVMGMGKINREGAVR